MPLIDESKGDRIPTGKPFGRKRPIYAILGGGKVADVLLWRDKKVSASILIAISVIWFLFEVVGYNFVTFFCHITITMMLVIFIWCMGSDIFKWPPPMIPKSILHDSSSKEVAAVGYEKLNKFLLKFFDVACGDNYRQFLLAIGSVWLLSVIGNYINTLNLLFLGCLCLETLPFVYEKYEEEVDYVIGRLKHRMKELYQNFDSEFLRQIPKGPPKKKKAK